ncbi:hypothetical protein N7532_000629 [Penicillium argentinense]|uniref:Uncharacterized protein n=1 Tax=Penicillium argentinense TaxID=1131581 RepID=A0A9W9G5L2_9EURO|nr:uncharacterized protein N7532_000629 [Penicillium argentinense]KAJ5112584.1 hypothetical protein N7532_000629 [Penicillium argentinense]
MLRTIVEQIRLEFHAGMLLVSPGWFHKPPPMSRRQGSEPAEALGSFTAAAKAAPPGGCLPENLHREWITPLGTANAETASIKDPGI